MTVKEGKIVNFLQELVTLEGPGGRDVLMFVMSIMVGHIVDIKHPFEWYAPSETKDGDIILNGPVYS